ncbi:MAG: inosine/xanthosine triphosphatase [Bacillota bacterium]
MPKVVAVGSTNPAKVGAARAVLARAFPGCRVEPVAVPSGVREQPLGAAETEAGARNRARGALAAVPAADLAVGFEGGVDRRGYVINCCAVALRDGREWVAWGTRFPLPGPVAARVLAGEELGPVMDAVSGQVESKKHLGAIGILTRGLVTREEMWAQALAAALPPLLHPDLYRDWPPPDRSFPSPGAPGAAEVTRDFTVATFVVHEGRVLLLYHRKLQMWLPPGGHIDPNELPDEAAVREVREETGIEVELISRPAVTGVPGPVPLARPEGVQLEDIAPGHQHIDLIYFARPRGGTTPVLNPAESEAVGWFTAEDLARLPLTEEVRTWALRALAAAGSSNG